MKKITAIFICLTLCLGLLTGCASEQGKQAFDLYQKMNTAMADVKSLDMDMNIKMDISAEGSTISTATSGNIKEVIKSETAADMEMNFKVNYMGTELNMSAYYTDGVYYMDSMGTKSKIAMSVEEAFSQIGNTQLLDFAENAIKDGKISNAEGGKKVEFTLDGQKIASLTEQVLESMKSIDPNITAADITMNFSDMKCEAVIGSDNMMKSYRMLYDVAVTYQESTMNMNADMTMTVNSYNNVTVNLPADLDSYVDTAG